MFTSKLKHLIFALLALTLVIFSIIDIADGSANDDRMKLFIRWISVACFTIISIDYFSRWLNWKNNRKN